MIETTIPLALYIHMPWCVKKCPYCDFNSHGLRGDPDYNHYIDCLLSDLDADLPIWGKTISQREITSIFFGGGTPSLFPADMIARLLTGIRQRLSLSPSIEITLETNPGTVEHGRFEDYRAAGINRLSLGIQSFNDDKLKRLGRIHSAEEAKKAFHMARHAGFDNINLDLMYALPKQTLQEALDDVEQAIALEPTHISQYQLTIEPHTAFAAHPPPLPDDDTAWDMQEASQARLARAGFKQYEISAYARPDRQCRHNRNYWTFGDYLAIGAGAHGKITTNTGVYRYQKTRMPTAYMKHAMEKTCIENKRLISTRELPFEYMLNALRLVDGTPMPAFSQRTGVPLATIASRLEKACGYGWLKPWEKTLQTTALGQRFLNDVISLFMGFDTSS